MAVASRTYMCNVNNIGIYSGGTWTESLQDISPFIWEFSWLPKCVYSNMVAMFWNIKHEISIYNKIPDF
jgi:uncharacterized protein (DUF2225 family)